MEDLKKKYVKVVDEKFIAPLEKGGGIIMDDFVNYQEPVERFKKVIKPLYADEQLEFRATV